jgi:hypothetical protein
MKLTSQHIEALRAANRVVMQEIREIETRGDPVPPEFHHARITEICAVAAAALDRFLEGRKEAAKRINPLTCKWVITYTDVLDPYGIWASPECMGRDFVVSDENSEGEVSSDDLSKEQRRILRERIQREAGMPVLSSLANVGSGYQVMPMPSSSDPRQRGFESQEEFEEKVALLVSKRKC